jgi:hypothetical protein
MNTGIQDTYNLAWKLAFVLKGYAAQPLLETYNEERIKNAQRLLQTTDRAFEVVAGSNWMTSFVRTQVFPPLAHFIFSLSAVQNTVFPIVSQIGIHYRDCSLSRHNDDARLEVKAGDRMPYFRVDGKSIYDQLQGRKFHFLSFTDESSGQQSVREKIEDRYASYVDYHVVALSEEVTYAFGTQEPFHVLVRPDNYIASVFYGEPINGLETYFNEALGYS